MDSRPFSFAPIVVCASRERGGYRYLALTVTWSASLAHSQVTAPSELSRSRLSRPLYPDCGRRGPTGRGSTVEPRCGSDLAVPARLMGWSEPGNEAKGGDTS